MLSHESRLTAYGVLCQKEKKNQESQDTGYRQQDAEHTGFPMHCHRLRRRER